MSLSEPDVIGIHEKGTDEGFIGNNNDSIASIVRPRQRSLPQTERRPPSGVALYMR